MYRKIRNLESKFSCREHWVILYKLNLSLHLSIGRTNTSLTRSLTHGIYERINGEKKVKTTRAIEENEIESSV